MKITFEVHHPRVMNAQYGVPAKDLLKVLENEDQEIEGLKEQLRKYVEKAEIPFNELSEAISATQAAPVKRDEDGTPVQLRGGGHKLIPFTKEQHRANAAILNILFKAVDKIEENGETLSTMSESVSVELSPKQVKYLAKLITRRCQEYNFTGQHVVDFSDKFEKYAEGAIEEMKRQPKEDALKKSQKTDKE